MKRLFTLFFIITSGVAYSQCLVAQYPFSGNANDMTANANHGIVYGAIPAPDRFGSGNNAYYFDGIDDYIEVADNNSLDLTSSLTFSAWIRSDDPTQLEQTILAKPRDPFGTGYLMIFDVNTTGIAFNDGTVNTAAVISGVSPTPYWYHLVGTYDGSMMKLYINGQLFHWISEVFSLQNSSEPLSIGRESSILGRYFKGTIDDIKIYNCPLTASQIDSLYQVESVNTSACMIAEYDFIGNANDMSNNANHGTVYGATLTPDRFGNIDAGYAFNGANDFIRANDFNLGTSDFTIETWIKPNAGTDGYIATNRTNEGGGAGNWWVLARGSNQKAYFTMAEDGSANYAFFETNGIVTDDVWSKISVTRVGTDLYFYINGALDAVYPDSFVRNLTTGNNIVDIGGWSTFNLAWFNGTIDDLKVYGCALTAGQIDSLYQAEAPAQPCGLTVVVDEYAPLCFGGDNGLLDVAVYDGQSPYTFQWNTGSTDEDLSNLFAGDYAVIITDANGCDTMVNITLADALPLDISVNVTDAACSSNNGEATVTVTNGWAPFTYQWSSGDTTSTADSLTAGIYMVTVTDFYGCTEAETFGVNNSGGLSLSAAVTDASCDGIFDGDVDLTVTGGTSPYTYSWSNAATTEDLTNIKSGSYMVEVTDDNGCISVLAVYVDANSVDLSNANITNPTCGNADGSIDIFPSGGASPYSYQWSSNAGSATTSFVSSLAAGTYFVQVTDDNGCSEIQLFSLSNPGSADIELTSVSSAACNGSGGGVNISINSGQPPFTYAWSNGETTQDIMDVPQGAYSVDVADGNGCITSLNVWVPGATLPPISLCMSTVNSANGKVLCLWDKPQVDYISHFNIYRENAIAGQYDYWFTRPYDSTSQWTDQTANPQIRGWRYKVTYVDTCGNESPMGLNHKTIHLTANLAVGGGVNLIWDHYEGFNFFTFYIERYHSSTGWITIDSIPSSLHSYQDTTTLTGLLLYAVNITSPNECDPTRAGVNTSRSNIRNQPVQGPVGINENETKTDLQIYPNPANQVLNIAIPDYSGEKYTLKMHNAVGEIVLLQIVGSSHHQLDVREIPSGMYTLSLSSEEKQLLKKVMIIK